MAQKRANTGIDFMSKPLSAGQQGAKNKKRVEALIN
jgi:hypothetical protein